jgi:hypothetical protein
VLLKIRSFRFQRTREPGEEQIVGDQLSERVRVTRELRAPEAFLDRPDRRFNVCHAATLQRFPL